MVPARGKTVTADLNPRTTRYEFLGPPGALAICIGTPAVMYAMYFGCSEKYGGCPPSVHWNAVIKALTSWSWWSGLWDTQAVSLYLAYYGFLVLCWYVLPGRLVQGLPMRNGQVKSYKVNGESSARLKYGVIALLTCRAAFMTMLGLFEITAAILWRHGPQPLTVIYEKWVGLLTASTLMSFLLALGCYLASFRDGALLALGGNSGNPIYDVRSHLAYDETQEAES